MNKYILLIILILFSCESLFHEDNKYIVLDNEQEKVNIINGIYSLLIKVHNHEYFSLLSRSDDINMYGFSYYNFRDSDGEYCPQGNSEFFSFSEVSGTLFRNLYTAIISANRLINQSSFEEDRVLLGEVYFLRSYCYFKLARFFGTPPIVIDTDVNYQLEKPSYADLYELIESDMLMALELLPEYYNDSRIPGETPHKGTAKAMLAEIYLAMAGYPVNNEEKYAEAARYSGEVIEQANDYNYALLDDMANLWSVKHRHNTENIFGLFYKITNGEDGNTIGTAYIVWRNNEFSIHSNYKPELMFYNSFPDNYRKYTSLITGTYYPYGYDEIDTIISGLHYEKLNSLLNPCTYLDYVASIKYIDLNYIHAGFARYSSSEVTLYLLRYAQTLLTYAESKARIGEIDESAYEAVNKVRRRANKLNINAPSDFDLTKNLTSEQFLDSVVWERAWELCQEPDGRWFDIIRLDLKDKLKDYRYSYEAISTIPATILNSDWYFYLIPQEDRWLNPNFEEED